MKRYALLASIILCVNLIGGTGGQLPRYGTTCSATEVRGNPHEWAKVEYMVPTGTLVRLRDRSRDGLWVMIKPAYWIEGKTLCGW